MTQKLEKSGLHWELAMKFTGTATKAQLVKWLFWVLGALGVGAGVGSTL